MADEKNEFEDLGVEDDVPEQTFSETPESENMIAAGSSGTVYDWNQAPSGIKAPPRIDLNGKIVTIKKAEIVLPPKEREWQKSRDGKKEYKYCSFVLHYSGDGSDGQQEFHSGCRVFKREVDGKALYSHPTIMNDRKNQTSKLKGAYADYKGKDINEVSLKEFMAFLNGEPKAKLMTEEVKNPVTGEVIKKNFVEKFVDQNEK